MLINTVASTIAIESVKNYSACYGKHRKAMESTVRKIDIPEIQKLAVELGRRIRTARIRRKKRQEDLALTTGLSRSTIQAIERGDTSCSLGNVLLVLWTLGLSREIELIADPGLDRDGLALSLDTQGKRVRVHRKLDNEF